MKLKLLLLFAIAVHSLHAQPKDNSLIMGKLDNGLTYYIKKGEIPKGKVDFYLVQNVGAMMEDDDQNGLAHFLEHMAFNGTENFPNGIQTFLNRYGVTNFNAMTGFDETVYYISDVPSDKKPLVDSCMLILRDWAAYISLDTKQIDRERGVILEERRTTRNAGTSVREIANKTIYNGSKYATHDIIGTTELLENFAPETLRTYYKDFYRPDLQAVIVVGDIVPSEVEKKMKELFAPIPKRVNPKERKIIKIPDNIAPMLSKAVVKEAEGNSISMMKRVEKEKITSLEQLVQYNILRSFYAKMINNRLKIYAEDSNPNFSIAMVEYGALVRGYDSFNVMIKPYNGKDREAFTEMMTEIERTHRFGFTKAELDEQKRNYLAKIEVGRSGSNLVPNKSYGTMYQNNFLLGTPIATVEEDLAIAEKFVKSLTITDMKNWVDSWYLPTKNVVYLLDGDQEDYDFPTLDELTKISSDIRTKELQPVDYTTEIPQLIDFDLKGGSVVSQKPMKINGAEKWVLSNGATVYFKQSSDRGKIAVFAESLGGKSLLEPKDLPSASAINTLALYSGIYKHTGRQMKEYLKDKSISLSLKLSETAESINGESGINDAEDFFSLLYMLFEKPRFDRAIFDKYVFQEKFSLSQRKPSPLDAVKNEMNELLLKKSPRLIKVDTAFYDAMNYDRMVEIYKERFSNASDFVFYVSGDITSEQAQKLVSKYIGAIASTNKKENYRLHDNTIRQSITKDFSIEMAEPKYVIDIEYSNYYELTRKEELLLDALGYILNNRYNAQIREDEGGTYGVNVSTGATTFPIHKQSLNVSFETSMEKGEYLRMLVHKQLESIVKIGVLQEELDDFVLIMKRNRQSSLSTTNNQFWIEVMRNYVDTNMDITSEKYFESIVDKIQVKEIQTFLKKFMKNVECKDIVIKANS